MKNRKISLGLLLMMVALVVVPGVTAYSQYVKPLQTLYGNNLSCGACHIDPSGGETRNAYGLLFQNIPTHAADPAGALKTIGSPVVLKVPGKNLVLNPGFENGTIYPINWTLVRKSNNSPILDNVSHRGSKSIKIHIPGTTDLNSGYPQSDLIIVKPNRTYIASVWGKTQNADGNNTPAVRVVELDANKSWIRQTNLPVFNRGTNNWTQRTLEFQTEANTSYIYFYGNIWKGFGTFWMDDFKLKLKS